MSDSFPFKWINKKWKEGFYVTSMATSHTRWAVVMSRNAGFVDQCVELDFQYPSEGIHRRWDAGGMALPQHTLACIVLCPMARRFDSGSASRDSFLMSLFAPAGGLWLGEVSPGPSVACMGCRRCAQLGR